MSASAIGWIVSIFFIVILGLGFLIGMWRGLKKSTANLIFSSIGIMVAFFVTPLITNAILGINIDYNGQQVSLSQYIVEMLKQEESISSIINRNPNMETFIEGLPGAIANVVVFLVVTLVIELVIYIIYRIVASTALKNKEDEKKHRLFGGLVGVAKTFVLTIFAFMPLAGLIGLYSSAKASNESFLVSSENVQVEEQNNSSLLDQVPDEVDEILTGLENNALIKICGVFGLDNATFDYYSKVKVEENTIYIRQEIENILPLANFVYQLSNNQQSNIKFADVDYDKLEVYVDNILEGGLFNGIIVDLANDIVQNYQSYPFISESQDLQTIEEILLPVQTTLQEYSQNHEMLEQYFANDVKNIFTSVKTLAQDGLLDEILNMPEGTTTLDTIELLVSDANITTTETTLNTIFDINIVRDAIAPITEMLLENVSQDIEQVSVDTSSWGENDWEELSSSLIGVVKEYSSLSEQVDIMSVVEDPTILISDDSLNITNITTSLGSLIDNARAIKLFYNAQGQSVIDNLLGDFNISLPTSVVYDAEGQERTISNYKELFTFISPALETIKENDLYDLLNNSPDALSMMSGLANIVSQEGNEDLLSQIILPLSQVEPTKTFVVEEMLQSISNNLVDFTSLTTYDDWKKDLGYISSLFVTLNTLSANGQSFLELAVNGDVNAIIDNVSEDNLSSILKPIMYAKSTEGLRNDIFTILSDVANDLTSSQNSLNFASITLVEGNSEDQTDEIIDAFAKFLAINGQFSSGMSIRELDKTDFGAFLTAIQINACRTDYENGKQEPGLLRDVYYSLLETIKTEYSDVISQSQTLAEMLEEANYPYIDFVQLFELIEQIESMM